MRPTARAFERDAPVLRLAALGDVELREHLQARRDAVRHPLRDALRLVEHAVDADAHEQRVLLRLEVDVAGAVGGGLHHDRVDEPHERRVRDAVVDLEVVVLVDHLDVVERRLRLHRLALAGEPLELARISSRFATPISTVYRVASRSSSMPWMFAGSATATRSRSSVRDTGTATTRCSVFSGISSAALGRRPLLREVDEREAVAARERPGDAVRVREALVLQRLREADDAGATAGGGEPVARNELGRGDQLGDEIGDRLEAVAGSSVPIAVLGDTRSRRGWWMSGAGLRARSSRCPSSGIDASCRRSPSIGRYPVNPRYQSRIASPANSATTAPSARNGTSGIAILRAPGAVPREQDDGRDERCQEPDHQRHDDVQAEHGAEQQRQLDVAHAEPLRVARARPRAGTPTRRAPRAATRRSGRSPCGRRARSRRTEARSGSARAGSGGRPPRA